MKSVGVVKDVRYRWSEKCEGHEGVVMVEIVRV